MKFDPEKDLIGTKHDYSKEPEESLTKAAKTIGFSSKEIDELERLYKVDAGQVSAVLNKTLGF